MFFRNIEKENEPRLYRSFFKNSAGVKHLNIKHPDKFFIEADSELDLFISTIIFYVDGAFNLDNGIKFYFRDPVKSDVVIHDGIKNRKDLVSLCMGRPSLGSGSTAFDYGGTCIQALDLKNLFGLPYGIKIKAESSQKLIFLITDDTSLISNFTVQAYGFLI